MGPRFRIIDESRLKHWPNWPIFRFYLIGVTTLGAIDRYMIWIDMDAHKTIWLGLGENINQSPFINKTIINHRTIGVRGVVAESHCLLSFRHRPRLDAWIEFSFFLRQV